MDVVSLPCLKAREFGSAQFGAQTRDTVKQVQDISHHELQIQEGG